MILMMDKDDETIDPVNRVRLPNGDENVVE